MSNTTRVNFVNVKFRINKSILCKRQHLMKPEQRNYRLRQWVCFSNSYLLLGYSTCSWPSLWVHGTIELIGFKFSINMVCTYLGQQIIITVTTTINQPHMIQTFKCLSQSKNNCKKLI